MKRDTNRVSRTNKRKDNH